MTYTVNWGDGTSDPPITADDLAAEGDQVTHVFASAPTSPITVDLSLDSATYSSVGTQSVTVDTSVATMTTLSITNSPANFGDKADLQAVVAPQVAGEPTGTVEFFDQIGSGSIIDLGAGTLNPSTGVATFPTQPLIAGSHSFTAVYGGDDTFTTSTSSAAAVSILNNSAGNLTMTGDTAATEGNTTTSYALTLPTTAGGHAIDTWLITWGDGSADTALSGTFSNPQSHVFGAPGTLAVTAIAVNSLGAAYTATLNSGSVHTVTVSAAAPSITSITADNAYYSGADSEDGSSFAPDQLHVSFAAPASQESYNVSINWGDGSPATTFALDPGQTEFDYPLPQYLGTGSYGIIVTVTDAESNSASNATPLTVNYSNSESSDLVLSLDQTIIQVGGGGPTLSGSFTDAQDNVSHDVTIDWGDGTTESPDITSVNLDPGETTFQAEPNSTSYATAGNFTINVTVTGVDGTIRQSTSVAVTTTLTNLSAPATGTYGESVTLTATVLPTPSGAGTPTGTVDFYDETTGEDFGTAGLNGSGVASLPVSDFALGDHSIIASYSGDDNFPGSDSSAAAISITAPPISITNVSFSPTTVTKGNVATLTGTVANIDGAGFTVYVEWDVVAGVPLGGINSFTYPAGATGFVINHQFLDYGSELFNGGHAVNITVTPADGRDAAVYDASINGEDAAPSVNITSSTLVGIWTPNEVELSALVADPGQYGTMTYSWTVTGAGGAGVLSMCGASTPNLKFVPSETVQYTVHLTVTDADGGTGQASATIPVANTSASGGVWLMQPDEPTLTIEQCDVRQESGHVAGATGQQRLLPRVAGAGVRPVEPCHDHRALLHGRRRSGRLRARWRGVRRRRLHEHNRRVDVLLGQLGERWGWRLRSAEDHRAHRRAYRRRRFHGGNPQLVRSVRGDT